MSEEKQIEKVWMLRERKDFDPKGFWLDLLKSHLEKKGRQTNEKCRYCLKPNIKTTCFEWNGDGAESCISMHLMIAFVKLLLLSSYERCSLKIAQEVCLLRLTFSLLFSSDFRRPRALRYRQARGWGRGENISDWIFLAKLLAALVCCVVSCVRRRHSNQTAGSVKSALLTQLFQFVGLVWFLVSRQNQTKSKQEKAGGTIEASGGFIKGGHETLMLYLRAAIGISLEEQC